MNDIELGDLVCGSDPNFFVVQTPDIGVVTKIEVEDGFVTVYWLDDDDFSFYRIDLCKSYKKHLSAYLKMKKG